MWTTGVLLVLTHCHILHLFWVHFPIFSSFPWKKGGELPAGISTTSAPSRSAARKRMWIAARWKDRLGMTDRVLRSDGPMVMGDPSKMTGWWLEHDFYCFHVLGIIIPTDELIVFRGVETFETTNQMMVLGCFRGKKTQVKTQPCGSRCANTTVKKQKMRNQEANYVT